MLQSVAVDNIAHHQLVGYLGVAYIQVPQPALARHFVINRNVVFLSELTRDFYYLGKLLRLQRAVAAVDNSVAVK